MFCYTDTEWTRRCMKVIGNIKLGWFSKVFICSGQSCNFNLSYSSPTVFPVQGINRCAFDNEREYHWRVRNQLALGAIEEDVTLRPRVVINLIMNKTTMSEMEKKTLPRGLASSFNEGSEVSRANERSCSRTQICHRQTSGCWPQPVLIYDCGTDDPAA